MFPGSRPTIGKSHNASRPTYLRSQVVKVSAVSTRETDWVG
jgi:hypothetical protein